MDENSKTLLILLSGLVIIMLGFLVISGNMYPCGFDILGIDTESEYDYEVVITSSETLYNVTMFLPLPSHEGRSPAGYALLGGEGYGSTGNSAEIFGEGDSLFLKVMLPETDGLTFGISIDSGELIDTVNPVENSYTIRPVKNLKAGDESDTYNTYLYAEYDCSPGAVVTIDIKETGKNSWETLSLKKNYFDAGLSLSLTGSADKWYATGVTVNKRKGDYSILF